MLINEIFEGTPQIFGKYKNKVKKRFRCAAGPRKGRIVANPETCTAPINIKKRQTMKTTRAGKSTIQGKRASFTKKYNPISKIVKGLNKQVKSRRRTAPIKLGKR
jgi:hypothetical protein